MHLHETRNLTYELRSFLSHTLYFTEATFIQIRKLTLMKEELAQKYLDSSHYVLLTSGREQ